ARRAHDRDAQRVGERGRHHQGPDPGVQPRAPGCDHPGNHGSRRWRGIAGVNGDLMAATTEKQNVGRIEEIQGVVIEAVFPDELPEIYSAITVTRDGGNPEEDASLTGDNPDVLVCEVQQHLGDDRVRAVAMDSTDGLARGMEVVDTGGPITVPVG